MVMTSSNGNIFHVTDPLWGYSPIDSSHKDQWWGALMFSMICGWTNGWANNGDTGVLRRYRSHYDVTVMLFYLHLYQWNKLLTHWGRATHICVSNITIIVSDNDLSPGRRQAIIWTNAGILFIGPLGTNFSEILIGIQTLAFKKIHLEMSSAKWRLFSLGLSVLRVWENVSHSSPKDPFY